MIFNQKMAKVRHFNFFESYKQYATIFLLAVFCLAIIPQSNVNATSQITDPCIISSNSKTSYEIYQHAVDTYPDLMADTDTGWIILSIPNFSTTDYYMYITKSGVQGFWPIEFGRSNPDSNIASPTVAIRSYGASNSATIIASNDNYTDSNLGFSNVYYSLDLSSNSTPACMVDYGGHVKFLTSFDNDFQWAWDITEPPIFIPTPPIEDVYPHVMYTLDKTHLVAHTIPWQGITQISGIDYYVFDSDDNQIFTFGWDNGELHNFNYDFTKTGNFHLHAKYRIPFPVDPSTYTNLTNDILVVVTGSGSVFAPPTNQTCTIADGVNSCTVTTDEPIYADCSGFSSDIAGAIKCNFDNFTLGFGYQIQNTLEVFFTPNMSVINVSLDELKTTFQSKLGFVTFPVDFISSLASSLPLPTDPTYCVMHFGTFMTAPVDYDICEVERDAPELFYAIQTGVIATVSVSVMVFSLKKYKEFIRE